MVLIGGAQILGKREPPTEWATESSGLNNRVYLPLLDPHEINAKYGKRAMPDLGRKNRPHRKNRVDKIKWPLPMSSIVCPRIIVWCRSPG